MRSWLAILLLVCMVLQWAPATTKPHDGLCALAHHIAPAPSAGADSHAGPHTADCGACHHGCSLALLGAVRALSVTPTAFPVAPATPQPTSRPADLPERPQWRTRG